MVSQGNKLPAVIFYFSGIGGRQETNINISNDMEEMGFDVMTLTDRHRRFFVTGADGLESQKELRDEIRAARKDYHRVFCVGFSAGGFGALKYGIECNVDHIIGINAFTTFDNDALAELEKDSNENYRRLANLYSVSQRRNLLGNGNRRDTPEAKRKLEADYLTGLRRLALKFEPNPRRRNVRNILASSKFAGDIALYFSSGMPVDVYMAQNMKDFDNVSLHPQATDQHVPANLRATVMGILRSHEEPFDRLTA